jgi:hypothetical protein
LATSEPGAVMRVGDLTGNRPEVFQRAASSGFALLVLGVIGMALSSSLSTRRTPLGISAVAAGCGLGMGLGCFMAGRRPLVERYREAIVPSEIKEEDPISVLRDHIEALTSHVRPHQEVFLTEANQISQLKLRLEILKSPPAGSATRDTDRRWSERPVDRLWRAEWEYQVETIRQRMEDRIQEQGRAVASERDAQEIRAALLVETQVQLEASEDRQAKAKMMINPLRASEELLRILEAEVQAT